MAIATTQESIVRSAYNIYMRPNFTYEATAEQNARMIKAFADDITSFLDSYREKQETIMADMNLSQIGKTNKLVALREAIEPHLARYTARVVNLVDDYNHKREEAHKVPPFKGTGDIAADETRASEIRALVRAMEPSKAIALFFDPTTPPETMAAIENSPIPMFAPDIMARGKELSISRRNPEAMEELADYRYLVESIRKAVLNAYLYAETSMPPEPALREELPEL